MNREESLKEMMKKDEESGIYKQLTAVEWLVEKLDQNFDYVADTIIEQAKAMEKEQIINAFMEGADFGEMFNNEGRGFITDAEQYYNNNYKSE